MTKIIKVEVYDYTSTIRPSEVVSSFIEAAVICANKNVHKIIVHLDNGNSITFDDIEFANQGNFVEINL